MVTAIRVPAASLILVDGTVEGQLRINWRDFLEGNQRVAIRRDCSESAACELALACGYHAACGLSSVTLATL